MRVGPHSALRLTDLTLGYDRRPAVHHLTGDVPAGALLAVVGPNGAGKSTLLKAIAGILPPLSGHLERIGAASPDIAFLPQIAEIDRDFPICVYDLVAMGLWRQAGAFGRISRAMHARIEQALAAVGLVGFERRPIGSLSGGQMQRALFARLLLQDARIILLDEPFAAVDQKTVSDLIHIIRRWHAEKRIVIAVLHDLGLAKEHFPDCLLLAREAIAWGPTTQVLTPANLLMARRMVEAWDEHAAACHKAA